MSTVLRFADGVSVEEGSFSNAFWLKVTSASILLRCGFTLYHANTHMPTMKRSATMMPLTTPAIGNDEGELGAGVGEDVGVTVPDFLVSEMSLL